MGTISALFISPARRSAYLIGKNLSPRAQRRRRGRSVPRSLAAALRVWRLFMPAVTFLRSCITARSCMAGRIQEATRSSGIPLREKGAKARRATAGVGGGAGRGAKAPGGVGRWGGGVENG